MTARQGIHLGESDPFSPQVTELTELQVASTEDSEIADSMTHLLGGVSGLLFALSLSFLLQAPLVSLGVLLTLGAGWTGRAIFQTVSSTRH